jgi:hypothetical protein
MDGWTPVTKRNRLMLTQKYHLGKPTKLWTPDLPSHFPRNCIVIAYSVRLLGYGLGDTGFDSEQGKDIFLPRQNVQTGPGATRSSIQLVPMVLSLGVRRVRLIAYLHLVSKLTFLSLLVTWCTTSLTFNNCTLCPHCIYVFCIYLRTDSDLCHLQHKLIVVFITEMKSVYSAVRTGSLNKAVCASSLKG